jgi:hypothetical protein
MTAFLAWMVARGKRCGFEPFGLEPFGLELKVERLKVEGLEVEGIGRVGGLRLLYGLFVGEIALEAEQSRAAASRSVWFCKVSQRRLIR